MEELNDEELQELLGSSGINDINGINGINGENTWGEKAAADLVAYQNLFKVLDTAPEEGLSFSFAANVRRKVQEQLNRKSDFSFNMLSVLIFTLSILLGYGLLYMISQSTAGLVFNIIMEFKWVFVCATGLFFCVQVVDQRLVKRS